MPRQKFSRIIGRRTRCAFVTESALDADCIQLIFQQLAKERMMNQKPLRGIVRQRQVVQSS